MSLPNVAPSLLIRGSSQHLHDSRQRRIEVTDRGKGSKGKDVIRVLSMGLLLGDFGTIKMCSGTPDCRGQGDAPALRHSNSPHCSSRMVNLPNANAVWLSAPLLDKKPPPTRIRSEERLPTVVPRPSFSRGVPPPIPHEAALLDSSSDSEDEFYKKFMKRRRQTVVTKEKPRGRPPDRRRVEDELVITIKPWERPDAAVPMYGLLGSIGKRESAMKPVRVDRTPTRGGKAAPQVAEE